MLRRVTDHEEENLLRVVPLLPRLLVQPLGQTLPNLRVGRHPNNDVVLTCPGLPLLLSRQHAVITFDGEQFTLVDLDTTNGSYVRAGARALNKGPSRALVLTLGAPRAGEHDHSAAQWSPCDSLRRHRLLRRAHHGASGRLRARA